MIIWAIAKTTIGDAMRKKVIQIFLVVAVGLIVISLSFSQTLSFSTKAGSSTDLMLMKSFGYGLMAVAGLFISLVMGVSLIPQEIERRTIYTILSKPVNRYEFIIGKFLGAAITLAINIGLMGIVFFAAITLKALTAEAPAVNTAAGAVMDAGMHKIGIFDFNVIWGVILIYLQFLVLSGVVVLLSTFVAPTVNFFLGAGVYMLGTITPMTQTIAEHAQPGSMNPLIKGLYYILSCGYVIPNFDKFNVTNALLHPEAHITNLGFYTFQMGLVAVLYVLLMMTLAVIVFWKKEV